MRISQALVDELVDHARADAPDECCGMIASRDGEAVTVHRVTNAAHSPLRYIMEPMEQYHVQTAIDDSDLDLGAIYHSHTRSAPEPSQTDINLAVSWPDPLYVIVGVADAAAPEVRTWRIVDGVVTEAPLEIR